MAKGIHRFLLASLLFTAYSVPADPVNSTPDTPAKKVTQPSKPVAPIEATTEPTAAKVYKAVSDSIFTVYSVDNKTRRGIALGSAVAVGDHILATNCHIALAGDFLVVKLQNQAKVGELFFFNKKDDLCLVVVPGAQFKAVPIRPSKEVQIGEEVYAIGNPIRYEKTISKGIISNKFQDSNDLTILQTDAPISAGSSGGGLFDTNGKLIGLTTKKSRNGESIGFAIPTELILSIVKPKNMSGAMVKTDIKNTSASSNNDPRTAAILKTYNSDRISLVKWNKTCFITFTGINGNHNMQGIAIWFPTIPNGFFIFPNTTDVMQATDILNRFLYKIERPLLRTTENNFIINNESYALHAEVNGDKTDILILGKGGNYTSRLRNNQNFSIKLTNDNSEVTPTMITFDLSGFNEALDEFNAMCRSEEKQAGERPALKPGTPNPITPNPSNKTTPNPAPKSSETPDLTSNKTTPDITSEALIVPSPSALNLNQSNPASLTFSPLPTSNSTALKSTTKKSPSK